jgi:hypothetical protein
MKSKQLSTGLILLFIASTPCYTRADLFKDLAEKRRDSVKEFDLSGDPSTQAKTFVDGKKLTALKGVKRVAIPNFQVEFSVENSASAFGGGSGGSASVKSKAVLVGVDGALMQKLANEQYDKLVADLTAAGVEVLPYEKFKDNENYLKIKSKFKESGVEFRSQDGRSVFYSAHGMPMYFFGKDTHVGGWDAIGGALTTVQPQNIEPSIARDLDATLLSVRMVVDIAKQKSSGQHMMGGFASVKTTAQLNIMAEFTDYKFLTPHNGTAVVSLAKHLNSEEQIFELKKASDKGVDMSALGGANSSKVAYVLITTPDAYSKAVGAHLNAAEAMFMSVVKENL